VASLIAAAQDRVLALVRIQEGVVDQGGEIGPFDVPFSCHGPG